MSDLSDVEHQKLIKLFQILKAILFGFHVLTKKKKM